MRQPTLTLAALLFLAPALSAQGWDQTNRPVNGPYGATVPNQMLGADWPNQPIQPAAYGAIQQVGYQQQQLTPAPSMTPEAYYQQQLAAAAASNVTAAQAVQPMPEGAADDQPEAANAPQPPLENMYYEDEGEMPSSSGPRIWVTAEFLYWWIKDGPLSTPLITTGPGTGGGTLAEPSTIIIFGDSDMDFDPLAGTRMTAGFWFTPEQVIGIEGSGFYFERRSSAFRAAADANGAPLLARPFQNAGTGNEVALAVATPGLFSGSMDIGSTSRLYGAELNLTGNAFRSADYGCEWLFGFRYADLNEGLLINELTQPVPGASTTFLGNVVPSPAQITITDRFQGINKFYGPQIGGRFACRRDRFFFGAYAKVAFGYTDQNVQINGNSVLLPGTGAAPQSVNGGLFAQVTNTGRFGRNRFAVMPEFGVNLGVQILPRVIGQFGYSFMYWSHVVRPGNQIDRSVSDSLIPTSQFFGQPPAVNRPQFQFRDSDFWAQGVNFGLTFLY